MKRVNPDQFKLFMSGEEWKQSVTASTDGPIDKVWPRKEAESKSARGRDMFGAHGAGVYDSMKKHGYNPDVHDEGWNWSPPTILVNTDGRKKQFDGHHRVAAAAAIERETGKPVWLPTNYEEEDEGGYTSSMNLPL
jgi:hypothetical protein